MVIYKTGNLLDDQADILVIPVNCKGVMGAGLAKEAAKTWPHIAREFASDAKTISPGEFIFYQNCGRTICLLATKDDWRNPSKLEWVDGGLLFLSSFCKENSCSIAVPALGCGLGGLSWADVKPLMEHYLKDIDARVYLPKTHQVSLYTARLGYRGPDAIDITRKGEHPVGIFFAPSCSVAGIDWQEYVRKYTSEMRDSYRQNKNAWRLILAKAEVTLVCYCTDASHCHRTVLADIFTKLGANYHGERKSVSNSG